MIVITLFAIVTIVGGAKFRINMGSMIRGARGVARSVLTFVVTATRARGV